MFGLRLVRVYLGTWLFKASFAVKALRTISQRSASSEFTSCVASSAHDALKPMRAFARGDTIPQVVSLLSLKASSSLMRLMVSPAARVWGSHDDVFCELSTTHLTTAPMSFPRKSAKSRTIASGNFNNLHLSKASFKSGVLWGSLNAVGEAKILDKLACASELSPVCMNKSASDFTTRITCKVRG